MDYATRMRTKLTSSLQPVRLEIEDESHRHAGHAGADPVGHDLVRRQRGAAGAGWW